MKKNMEFFFPKEYHSISKKDFTSANSFEQRNSMETWQFEKSFCIKENTDACLELGIFAANIIGQSSISLSFEIKMSNPMVLNIDLRDQYGRLIFVLSIDSFTGYAKVASCDNAISEECWPESSDLVWENFNYLLDQVYLVKIRLDFDSKKADFRIEQQDKNVVYIKNDVQTSATNLAWFRRLVTKKENMANSISNLVLINSGEETGLPLKNKLLYAFGDSIIAGHTFFRSFVDYACQQEGIVCQKFAMNGASVIDFRPDRVHIFEQITLAPDKEPDFIVFDGGTNDAFKIGESFQSSLGKVKAETNSFNHQIFAEAFYSLVTGIKTKWPNARLIYVAPHKIAGIDKEIQEGILEIIAAICQQYQIYLVNLYRNEQIDTNNIYIKNKFTFDSNDNNGLPGRNGSGTHPNLLAVEQFYVPELRKALRSSFVNWKQIE